MMDPLLNCANAHRSSDILVLPGLGQPLWGEGHYEVFSGLG